MASTQPFFIEDEATVAERENSAAVSLWQGVMTTMARPLPLRQNLEAALQQICAYGDCTAAHLVIAQPASNGAELEDVWHGSFDALQRWYAAASAAVVPLHQQVRAQQAPLWLSDLAQAGLTAAQPPPNLAALLMMPVPLQQEQTTVLELFAPAATVSAPAMVQTVSFCGRLLGMSIQHQQTEDALRKSERRFRAIFNQTFQFIGLLSPDGTLIEANDTALVFGGIQREEVIGTPFWQAHWWSLSAKIQSDLRKAIARAAEGEFIRYEVDVVGGQDDVLNIDFSINPIRDQAGNVVLLIFEGRDVTQFKQTIEQLRASERRLAEAQQMAHVGYWEWNVHEDKILWSEELYRIFGIAPGSFDGTYASYQQLLHPEDRGFMAANVQRALEEGVPFDQHHRIIRPDGELRWLHGSGRGYFNEHGEAVKLAGVAQDVTEQRLAELQLEKTVQQLSAINEMGQAITASVDLHLIYGRVLSLTRSLLHADKVLIFLHDGSELVVAALSDEQATALKGRRIPDNYGIAVEVWQTGESILLSGDSCQQRLSPLLTATGYVPQAVIAVPIRWQQRAIGVLEATHNRADGFKNEDIYSLETAATWTAIAIGNAQQYAALQRRLRESEATPRSMLVLPQRPGPIKIKFSSSRRLLRRLIMRPSSNFVVRSGISRYLRGSTKTIYRIPSTRPSGIKSRAVKRMCSSGMSSGIITGS